MLASTHLYRSPGEYPLRESPVGKSSDACVTNDWDYCRVSFEGGLGVDFFLVTLADLEASVTEADTAMF